MGLSAAVSGAGSDSTVLDVRQVVKRFGGLVAVDHVDLSVERGAIVSIIGPNGSGKTTLFNVITGVYHCDAGQVVLDGEDISRLPPYAIALCGLARTFQTIRLFNNLSVLDNVLVGAHGAMKTSLAAALFRPPSLRRRELKAREKALEVLSIFGERLLPRLDQPAFSLSYANRRRLEIARALASDPKVLLLDEPTAGMNPAETAELVEQIHHIRSREHTILMIEHKLNVVNRISDRVVVLDHGAKLMEGTAEQIGNDERVIEAYLGQSTAAEI
ncbi:MAG: ABC transporter ATP-binding protein [Chloroflexi bacterium]|nr:ABC transporter ATP-binding protein [Chloroflexota bacterium]